MWILQRCDGDGPAQPWLSLAFRLHRHDGHRVSREVQAPRAAGGTTVMKVFRCTDLAHFYLPCGAPHGYPIGAQADDYHWHLADDDGNLSTPYHAACKPSVPPIPGSLTTI